MNVHSILRQFGERDVVGFVLVLARIGPLFVLAPLFSSRMVQPRVRGVVAVAIAVGMAPVVVRGHTLPSDPLTLAGIAGKEMLVGLAFAFAVGAFFAAISVAGSILDTVVGFSFGSLVDPLNGNQSGVLSQLYGMVALAVFIAIGGDGWVMRGLSRTYDLVPLAGHIDIGSLTAGVQHAFTTIFTAAVQVAGPVVLALVLTDAGFGLVSRVVPQLNVFGVAFPAKVAVGLLLIGVSLPFVAAWLANGTQGSILDALGALTH